MVPPVAELDVEVGDAVPGRSHECVEFRRDLRMGGQILPERPPEHLPVSRLAGADVVEQCPPGMGHPATDAVEVQEWHCREFIGGSVAGEPPGRFLREHPLGDEVAENSMQGVAISAALLPS